jgi:predicted TIM-barrel fold metal-dependent hydrolase
MHFFDCNVYFGRPSVKTLAPEPSVAGLLAEMDYNGVEKALVWHISQQDGSPLVGNELLAEAILPHPSLYGCWSIQPNQTKEFPPFDEFITLMRRARIVALRSFPTSQHFLLNEVSMGSWFAPMMLRRIPFFLSVSHGANWDIAYALLAEFPDLVCVLCDHGCWGEDRYFRPLIERYPNVYIDTSRYLLDGGIEAFVESYSAERMLFGSGYPDSYFGGMLMALLHSEIPTEGKESIASRNLERILSQADLEVYG